MSYRDLEIWKLARELTIEIHKMTINQLPKFEMYETGSLKDEKLYYTLHQKIDTLGKMINKFIQSIEKTKSQ